MIKIFTVIMTLVLLAGCSTYNIPQSPSFTTQQQWVIMPFDNYSGSPMASQQAEEIIASVLQTQGIKLTMYHTPDLNSIDAMINPSIKQQAAQQWLAQQQPSYIVTGSISEWRYKNGLDAEPSVGLTLKIIDPSNQQVIWRATGARSGWGRENLSQTASKVFSQIVDQMNLE